jgi:predicted MFS family arabinose efflux permease
MKTTLFSRWPKVAPNSMTARVLLAFFAAAGLSYVLIIPALVDGLKQGLGFTNRQAGLVASCNVYGAACGAFAIAFLVRRVQWRPTAHRFLFGLIAMDLLSMLVSNPYILMGARFMHGFIGGMLVGLSFSIIARTIAPDRTFGMLLLVQAFTGGIGVMVLPLLVPKFGTSVLFIAMILFTVATLIMLQFLPDYPAPERKERTHSGFADTLMLKPLVLALFATFFFQAANEGLFAFMIGLGRSHNLDLTFISETLGIAGWLAVLGPVLVIAVSTKFGIFKPIVGGIILTVIGTYVFNYSEVKWIWIAANVATGITWNFVISHLLGMCARFDQTGQAAVWSGFASKMGLASGPMLASLIVGTGNYSRVIVMALVLLTCAMLAAARPSWLLDRGAIRFA